MKGLATEHSKIVDVINKYDTNHGIPGSKGSGRRRKQKKQAEKEILEQLFNDESDDEYERGKFSRKTYLNYEHLSEKERHHFDSSFHVPKNSSQTKYTSLLQNPLKKIVISVSVRDKFSSSCSINFKSFSASNSKPIFDFIISKYLTEYIFL